MSEEHIKLEQCLFGYEDGHRLLASSVPLGNEVAALTELSDLAPGAVFGRSEGYWTGFPAPGISRYALMRTWLAPEMPRPGCVWTQAILLEPAMFEKVWDLSVLRSLFTRPKGLGDRDSYRRAVSINNSIFSSGINQKQPNNALLRALLRAIYGISDGTVSVDDSSELDDPLFAVWSQQWPRLRRNFRFQTAASREATSSINSRFDVTAILRGSDTHHSIQHEPVSRWIQTAASDAVEQTNDLRRFLWQYGADVRRQRGSFKPLVEVKLLHDAPEPHSGALLLKIIASSFPDPDDAVQLKQALVDGELVPSAQLDVLWYVMAHGGNAVFPSPTAVGVKRLALLWPERPEDLLHLAERTADADDPLGKSVFATVTGAVPIEHFWQLTASYPRVRQRMVMARPVLLAARDAIDLDNETMARMLRLISEDKSVVQSVLPRLLIRDDGLLSAETFDLFPQEAASEVIEAANGGSLKIGRAWLRELVRRPRVLLDPVVMTRVRRTSLLYELAEALGWLRFEVVAAGCDPWVAALDDIDSDLSDDKRDTLAAFFVALAIAAGGDAGRRMLEAFFDFIHDRELRSRLHWRARDILVHVLADVGWSKSWDYGLRLRLAVAKTYVRNGYSPESYGSLSSKRKVRSMLSEAALQIEGGKFYAQAVDQ